MSIYSSSFEFDLEMLQEQVDENARHFEGFFGLPPSDPVVGVNTVDSNLGTLASGSAPSFQSTPSQAVTDRLTMKALEETAPVLRGIVQDGRIQYFADTYGSGSAWHNERNLASEALYDVHDQYLAKENLKPLDGRRLPECGKYFTSISFPLIMSRASRHQRGPCRPGSRLPQSKAVRRQEICAGNR
jgi:hypothetical protein